jgi:hypothetical protein
VRVAEGGKLYRRGGKTHGWQEKQHRPVIRSRKACESGGGRKIAQERGEDPPPT